MLIDLRRVPGLDRISYDRETGLTIGARVTVRAVETSPLVLQHCPALAYAASTLASVQIRNLATLAGNICRASPSADTPPVLLALGASVTACGPSGQRTLLLEDFFTGPGRTALRRNEVLTSIHLPPTPVRDGAHYGAAYIKHSPRRAMDLALVGVAAAVTVEQRLDHWRPRRAWRGGADAATRSSRAEAVLLGCQASPELLQRAGDAAAAECTPISDVRGTAQHRRAMVAVLTCRAIEQALGAKPESAEDARRSKA